MIPLLWSFIRTCIQWRRGRQPPPNYLAFLDAVETRP
jgi:hypothetical protein